MKNSTNTIFIDRNGGIIYSEFMLTSLVICIYIVKLFAINWAWGVVLFLPLVYAMYWLFFYVWIWRFLFSTLCSFVWGWLAGMFVHILSRDNQSMWIIGIAAFLFMLWIHKDEYDFESSATINIFDYLGDR